MKGYKPDGFIETLKHKAKENMTKAAETGEGYEYWKGQFIILRQILDPAYGPCKDEHSVTMRMTDNYCVDCGIDIPNSTELPPKQKLYYEMQYGEIDKKLPLTTGKIKEK